MLLLIIVGDGWALIQVRCWCALQDEWLREKQAQLSELEETYERTINCVGEGHRQAVGEQIVS